MATTTDSARPSVTPVRWPLRVWLAVEIFFGVTAIFTIFLHPQRTADNFAWPIKPNVMAAALGAFYLSASVLFVIAIFAKKWQTVRVIAIPTALFAAVMLLTTFLHWNKFAVGSTAFNIWFASYVLPPPVFVALYLWQQRSAAPVGVDIGQPMPRAAQVYFRVNGVVTLVAAVVLYVFPSLLIAVAPWQFTPLTVRALCGWLVGVGAMQVWMAWEADRSRARLATAMLVMLPLALIFQLLRFRAEVDWANVPLWALLVDLLAVALFSVTLWKTNPGRHRG